MAAALHVVCPECDAVNRIPRDRHAEGGKCGVCHQPLFNGHSAALNEARFERYISRNDVPVVVDFWAPWCGPCRAMEPAYERAAGVLEPSVRLAKLNTEEAQGIASRFRVSSIPTLIVFQNGRELARTSGALPFERLVAWVRSAVAA